MVGRLEVVFVVSMGAFVGSLWSQGAAEQRVLSQGAKALHRYAEACQKGGLGQRARGVWRELVREYDEDHAAARAALGHQKLATGWVPDPNVVFGADTASPARARSLLAKWSSLADKLAKSHRELAVTLERDGDEDRMRYHAKRALRFDPSDRVAGELLGYQRFDGRYGSESEIRFWRRSHRLEQVLRFLRTAEFEVRERPETEQHAMLAAAGVEARGVRSEHFEIWGDLGVARLRELARIAERGLWFSRFAYSEGSGFRQQPAESAEMALFGSLETWQKVVRGHADLFEPAELDFLIQQCRVAFLEGERFLRVAAVDDEPQAVDEVLRAVVHDLANLRSEALDEGIGHAIVGMFTGQNLTYLLDRPEEQSGTRVRAKTSARELLPSIDEWLRTAIELAWAAEHDTPAQLSLAEPHDFSVEDRLVSWAFCDYLLRRDPQLLRALEDAAAGAASIADVRASFADYAGRSLEEVERDWRDTWTVRSDALIRVMTRDGKLGKEEKAADRYFAPLHRYRMAQGLLPFPWEPGVGSGVDDSHLLIDDAAEPDVADWLARPGHRHVLCHEQLTHVGYERNGSSVRLDVSAETNLTFQSATVYPRTGQTEVPRSVASSLLGPGATRVMAAAGAQPGPRIGYPITMHAYGPGGAVPSDVECVVRAGDTEVAGVLHVPEEVTDRRFEAPGMAVFLPVHPLPAATDVHVSWQWTWASGRSETAAVQFRTAAR